MDAFTPTPKTISDMERQKTKFDGKKALIVGKKHPHNGATCECMGLEETNVGLGLVFKRNDTNEEFFVFKPEDIIWK